MGISLFDVGVTNFLQVLNAVDNFLEKGRNYLNENGVDLPINSRSNIVQLFNEVELIFPNAIRPSGVNTIFKPVLISGEIQSYECIIYDRYGKELFRTEKIDEGWTGQLGLDYLPAQVYSFVAQVIDSKGKTYTYNGNVTIVK